MNIGWTYIRPMTHWALVHEWLYNSKQNNMGYIMATTGMYEISTIDLQILAPLNKNRKLTDAVCIKKNSKLIFNNI
jgi:hypothetical protein